VGVQATPVGAQATLVGAQSTLVGAQSTPVGAQSTIDNAISIVDNRPLSARIVGGGEAEPGAYPSVVALVRTGFGSTEQRLECGGTLVAERWVLTAAHCVLTDSLSLRTPESLRVVAGVTDLAQESLIEETDVLQIVIHPDYDGNLELPPNDIALLELAQAPAVEIAPLFTGESQDYVGSMGFIAGWGAIEYSSVFDAIYPSTLQDAAVPLVSDAVCNDPQSYDGLIVDSHLCAGFVDGEVDACAGDSGGPLFLKQDGVMTQAGIISFGAGCGLPLFYGIYTDVSHFIPWLSQYIPVPDQSPDLVAARQARATRAANDDDSFLGGTGVLWLLILGLITARANLALEPT